MTSATFVATLNQDILWEKQIALSLTGDPTTGNRVKVRARIELKKINIIDPTGERMQADGTVFVEPEHDFRVNEIIFYTDSTGNEKRFEIVDIAEQRDRDSLHHKELLIKRSAV